MSKNEIFAAALNIGRTIERDLWPCSIDDAKARAEEELEARAVPVEYRGIIRIMALQHVIAGK